MLLSQPTLLQPLPPSHPPSLVALHPPPLHLHLTAATTRTTTPTPSLPLPANLTTTTGTAHLASPSPPPPQHRPAPPPGLPQQAALAHQAPQARPPPSSLVLDLLSLQASRASWLLFSAPLVLSSCNSKFFDVSAQLKHWVLVARTPHCT